MAGHGRPPRLGDKERDVLVQIVEGDPTATLSEVQHELERRTGIRAHEQTILKTLKKKGFERSHDGAGVRVEQASEGTSLRYGYDESHREQALGQSYPTSVTDAEWALVRDLFENEGRPGKPPKYSRRLLLDACCYVVRTGGSWRMLPKEFPPWQNVCKRSTNPIC